MRGRIFLFVLVTMSAAATSWAGEEIDLDAWHARLAAALGRGQETEDGKREFALGLYPTVGPSIGPPNWASLQASAYVSFTNGKRFSMFGGYGWEWGPRAEARVVTVGWGAVDTLHVASKALGFHGKYVRYRRWEEQDNGVHHGISLGTESGAGYFSLAFEVGAARSSDGHWLLVAQVALKAALPVRIPLTRRDTEPGQ